MRWTEVAGKAFCKGIHIAATRSSRSFVDEDRALKRPSFSLRALFLFTTTVACFLTLNQVAWPKYSLVRYIGPIPDRCLRQPHTIAYGWPMLSRTDDLANHPEHASGPCKFNSTYHSVGLVVNLLVSSASSAVLVGTIVYLPPFFAWRSYLHRERRMIDRLATDQ